MNCLVLVLYFSQIFCFCWSITVEIEPRSNFCFYELVQDLPGQSKHSGQAKLKFTVLKGGKYRDISTTVKSIRLGGKTETYVGGRKVTNGEHNIPISAGHYSICFDNSFSMVTTKKVSFSWVMPDLTPVNKEPTVQTAVEFSLTELKEKVGNMTMVTRELKERNYQDSADALLLLSHVDIGSSITLLFMAFTSIVRVVYLRRLFDRPAPRC